MSANIDNVTLRPSESEPGEVIVTQTAGDLFVGADSGLVEPVYGVGEQEVPRPVVVEDVYEVYDGMWSQTYDVVS